MQEERLGLVHLDQFAVQEKCRPVGDAGGLLLHATADLPHSLGVDESAMYGDYYYLKSLLSLKALAEND